VDDVRKTEDDVAISSDKDATTEERGRVDDAPQALDSHASRRLLAFESGKTGSVKSEEKERRGRRTGAGRVMLLVQAQSRGPILVSAQIMRSIIPSMASRDALAFAVCARTCPLEQTTVLGVVPYKQWVCDN